jgi:demethylmenaquinone methyltransferase/2-methoxy-6-polyprenyl-1,4-benzoquinol methylase
LNQFQNKDGYVHTLFNSIASNYDTMNSIMTWGMLPRWQKFMLNKTELKPGNYALDVCCGTGELAFKMEKMVGSKGKIWGLDFSENMLTVANEKLNSRDNKNITFVQGNALQLPFEDNFFDAATNGFALRNVVDISQAIREMARVVKPGGKVVCLEVSRPLNRFFRLGFNVYFFKVVPLIGRLVDKGKAIDGKYPAYTWLPESLKTFPDQEKLKSIFLEAGLQDVKYYGVGFGAATVHVGTKK